MKKNDTIEAYFEEKEAVSDIFRAVSKSIKGFDKRLTYRALKRALYQLEKGLKSEAL